MSIGEDLRTFLINDAAIAAIVNDRVSQNKIPQADDLPAIWYRRSTSSDDDLTLEVNQSGETQFSESFDVECIVDVDELDEAEQLASAIKALNTSKGTFGTGTMQGVFVSFHDDNYRPTGTQGDDGRHVAALEVEIIGYKEP
jgi:hypothetical protein